jgi:uncharacterized delta-60 repeat protein
MKAQSTLARRTTGRAAPRRLRGAAVAAVLALSAAQASAAGDSLFAVARYTPAGGLDPIFDADGRVVTNFPTSTSEEAQAVAVDNAGKVVVAGYATVNGVYRFALARYHANGALDVGFAGGRVLTSFPGATHVRAFALAIDAQDRIVVGGQAETANGSQFALARYNPNGILDAAFDGDGRLLTNFPESVGEGVRALAIDPIGRIIAAGTAKVGNRNWFALARYTPAAGALDAPAFDLDGRRVTDMGIAGAGDAQAEDVAIHAATGTILVTGYAGVFGDYRIALARHNANGALDLTFDGDGRVLTNVAGSPVDVAKGIAVTAGNKIVVAGWANFGGAAGSQVALARYAWNGALDATFGAGGIVLTNVPGSLSEGAHDLAIDNLGRIVVAGAATLGPPGGRFLTARYTLNGELDDDYAGGGLTLTDFPQSFAEEGYALTLDALGNLVVAGKL